MSSKRHIRTHTERETQSQFKICEMNRNKQLKNVQFTMTNITCCCEDTATTVIFALRSKYRRVTFFSPLNEINMKKKKKHLKYFDNNHSVLFWKKKKYIKISSITTKFIQESQVEQHLQIGGITNLWTNWCCAMTHTLTHAFTHTSTHEIAKVTHNTYSIM